VVAIATVVEVAMVAMVADTVAARVHRARVAMVAGATGLVGQAVTAALLADKGYTAVHAVGRRVQPAAEHCDPKLLQHAVDFTREESFRKIPALDDCFIALGTTIKVAGSQSAFRAIDLDAVVMAAKVAHQHGATRLGVVSAMGADAKSTIFYNRIKGEMEEAVAQLGFGTLVIARPSMLAGNRKAMQQPERAGEGYALMLTRVLKPIIPANYRSILADDVACALVHAVQTASPGAYRLLSGEMQGASTQAPR
jgi:uncharacterized protein YbjT (DUF2867 family)